MGTGGTRCGAGRPGHRLQAEHTMKIDLRVLHKRGLLWEGGSNTWTWSRGGEAVGTIAFNVGAQYIRLTYALQGQDASQTIWTTSTPCRYGGSRRWFTCPCCGGRAVVLFMRSGRFACRACQKISYASQTGSETSRGYANYHRLHALIDAGKPKWQRWATFHRLEDRFELADARANQSLLQVIQRLQAGRY
jgi:hypothetical protein